MDTYEKKYNEALELARANHKFYKEHTDCDEHFHNNVKLLEAIFPELRESEDERISDTIFNCLYQCCDTGFISGTQRDNALAWLEKQKEIPMPNSTELIEMWHDEEAMLKEKDFRGNEWRLAYNAFLDGFAKGTCVKFEKQKEQEPITDSVKFEEGFKAGREFERREQKPINSYDIVPYIDDKIAALQDMWREEKVAFDWDDMHEMIEDVARHFYQKEQKPVEWSEEDEAMRDNILRCLQCFVGNAECESNPSLSTSYPLYQREIDWLKSLRPQKKEDLPKWLVDEDYDEKVDGKDFSLHPVGLAYRGYYIPYSDLLKLPREDEK